MTKKNLTFEQKSDKLFDALGITYAQVGLDDKDVDRVYTRKQLNRLVGTLAHDEDVNLLDEGYTFLRNVNERLVPDLDAIAKVIRKQNFELVETDYKFQLCELGADCIHGVHGSFSGALGVINVRSFEGALDVIQKTVNTRKMTVAVGILLLKEVAESGLPLESPEQRSNSAMIIELLELIRH